MLKNLLLASIILTPSLILAENTPQGSPRPDNICYEIGTDYYRCLQARPTCFWDEEDGRCEPLREPPGCGRIHNRFECDRSPLGCFWDDEDGRCERLH
jgi:hypothetical protein